MILDLHMKGMIDRAINAISNDRGMRGVVDENSYAHGHDHCNCGYFEPYN